MPQPARTALFGQNDVAEFGFHNSVYGIWVANGAFTSLPGTITLTAGNWYFAVASADSGNRCPDDVETSVAPIVVGS